MQRLLLFLCLTLLTLSCRKKVADDYSYYQPYKKDSAVVVEQMKATIDTTAQKLPEINPEEFRPANINDKYFIVIASFSVEEYALSMKKEMELKGFSPVIIEVNNDGWNKLAVSSYANFEEAKNALIQIKQHKGRFAEARLVVK